MKISVKAISAKGFEFTENIKPDSIGLLKEDVHSSVPIEVSARVERISNCVTAAVQIKIMADIICDRCLGDFKCERIENFKFNYVVDPHTEFVDLGEDIRQEVILNIPPKSICIEGCKGICVDCGANLNKEGCKCKIQSEKRKTKV